jgi:hypothetical protein
LAEQTQRLTKQANKIIILLYYYISILILFLASRGSYTSKFIKESAKPLRTQQRHAKNQKTKDTEVIEHSTKLKNSIIIPLFKQKKL